MSINLDDFDLENREHLFQRYAAVSLDDRYIKVIKFTDIPEAIGMEGNDVVVFDSKWVKVKQSDKGFLFLERKNRDSIAVLLLRDVGEDKPYEMLVRYQPLCVDHQLHACPITGGIDHPDQLLIDLARKEIEEEAGYEVGTDRIYEFGSYIVGTQTNEKCHMFLCDVTGLEPTIPQGDGTYHESISYNSWEPITNLYNCDYSAMRIFSGLMEEIGEFMDVAAGQRFYVN